SAPGASRGRRSLPAGSKPATATSSSSTTNPLIPWPPCGGAMSTCTTWTCDHRRRFLLAAGLGALALAAASLAPLPMPAQERNLAAARNGSQVIKDTSEPGGAWRAEKLIDEHDTPGGWASADGSLPQEIIVRLPVAARFNTLVFKLDSGGAESGWGPEISSHPADPVPPMGGWKLVATVSLARQPADQTFTVTSTDGRFVRLLITAAPASGAPGVGLGGFGLFLRLADGAGRGQRGEGGTVGRAWGAARVAFGRFGLFLR